ncbi:MAG: hypothetical protein HY049_04670 [Acidobacteria bacterium]|nr:hypothetical protein [Acidobacteriota bacterium]
MRAIRMVSATAVAVVALMGLGGLGCARSAPGSAKTSDELLTQLQQDRARIDEASSTMMKRIDMFNSSRKPGERTLQFSEIFTQDLNPEQRDVLDALVKEEKDISYRSLLQAIISDRDTIREMQAKLMHLEQTLPDKFVVARRGDKHHDLAMAYLTGEVHLDEAKAKDLLKQVDQTDELLAGNQVWFFYDPQKDTFRTYVTAGDAGQTPIAMRRAKTRELVKARDGYKKERDAAKVQVASLKQDKSQLSEARAQLESDLITRENSLFYHADSDRSLKEQGVLSPVLRRLQDVKGVSYDQSLDLRAGTRIDLRPQSYGLDEIRGVRVLPTIYQEGRDFTVEIDEDRGGARVVILDPDVFRGKEILVAVKG